MYDTYGSLLTTAIYYWEWEIKKRLNIHFDNWLIIFWQVVILLLNIWQIAFHTNAHWLIAMLPTDILYKCPLFNFNLAWCILPECQFAKHNLFWLSLDQMSLFQMSFSQMSFRWLDDLDDSKGWLFLDQMPLGTNVIIL